IEIVVTNDISDSKAKLIDQFGIPTIRVDLSKFYKNDRVKCRVDLEFIHQNLPSLLADLKLKSWVIPPNFNDLDGRLESREVSINQPANNTNTGCMVLLVATSVLR